MNCRTFFRVRIMAFSKKRISVGSTVMVHMRLMATPLARTMPTSAPILKLMKIRTRSPAMVVRELLDMAVKDSDRARCMQMVCSSPDSVSRICR